MKKLGIRDQVSRGQYTHLHGHTLALHSCTHSPIHMLTALRSLSCTCTRTQFSSSRPLATLFGHRCYWSGPRNSEFIYFSRFPIFSRRDFKPQKLLLLLRLWEVSKYMFLSKCSTHGYYMLTNSCILKPSKSYSFLGLEHLQENQENIEN